MGSSSSSVNKPYADHGSHVFKEQHASCWGRFRFPKDTPFKGNEKGQCSILFPSQLSYIRRKHERNNWLKSARKSIRQSGLTSFAKLKRQEDENHTLFEGQHQSYVEGLLEVNASGVAGAGQGVFAKNDIKKEPSGFLCRTTSCF